MTKDEYTKRLEKILFDIANYAVQLPRQYPNHNYEPSDGIVSGTVALFISEYNAKAITAIQQLNNEAIGETNIQVRGITQNKENPMYWTKGTKVDYELRQELKAVIGGDSE